MFSHTKFPIIEDLSHTFFPVCLRILVTRAYNNNPPNIKKKFVGPSKNNDEKEKEKKQEKQLQKLFPSHTNKRKSSKETLKVEFNSNVSFGNILL